MSAGVWATVVLLLPWQGPTGGVQGVVRSNAFPTGGAVVFLEPVSAEQLERPADTVMIDQRGLEFVPNLVAVTAGTVVRFRNSDPILHNVFSPPKPGEGFNLGTYPPPEVRSRTFAALGAHVILCHVHPEMLAYVVVVPTPHRAVVDGDGRFAIRQVPPGRYRLHVWRPYAAPLEREVRVGAGERLEIELELAPAQRRR